MIQCPAQKVKASSGYDGSSKCLLDGEHGPAQGAVSWARCVKCSHNRGSDKKTFKIKCGWGATIVELLSIPA